MANLPVVVSKRTGDNRLVGPLNPFLNGDLMGSLDLWAVAISAGPFRAQNVLQQQITPAGAWLPGRHEDK
jgi:hypothetical protein